MYELILLGIIPGTEIQITFLGWLMTALAFVTGRLLMILHRKQTLVWLRLIVAFYAMPLRQMRAV